MQVVDVMDPGNAFEKIPYFVNVQTVGRGIHEDGGGFLEDRPAVLHDEDRDHHGEHGVQPIPGFEHQHDAVYDHHHRGEKIAQHVQKGPAHVEIVAGIAVQEPGRQTVPDDPDHGHQDHQLPRDGIRMVQAMQGFGHDEGRRPQQDRHIDRRSENLHAPIAESVVDGSSASADAIRHIGNQHRGEVAEIMGRIGEQRHTVGLQPADHLDRRNEQIQKHGEKQPRTAGVLNIHMMMPVQGCVRVIVNGFR